MGNPPKVFPHTELSNEVITFGALISAGNPEFDLLSEHMQLCFSQIQFHGSLRSLTGGVIVISACKQVTKKNIYNTVV